MADRDAPAMLPEHARNPFIAALGPIRDYWGEVDLFERNPEFFEAERRLPAHLRRYCMLRLLDLNVPLARQVELAERIGMVIRKSYEGRDPAKGLHHAAILESVDRIENRDVGRVSARVVSTAMGFAVLGHPGMGKSRSVRIVLEALPKTLTPSTDSSVMQVPWVMIECQSLPTRKGLCITILTELGRRIGMDYVKMLDAERKPADLLVLQVQNKLVVHAVGLLVIDEVQNLADSRDETIKGTTLDVLEPLTSLLGKCGTDVAIVRAGLTDGEAKFKTSKPQIVFLDYYLSSEAVGDGLTPAVKAKARKTSIGLLNRLLASQPEEDPAIVLMSSEQVKAQAQKFRQSVEKLGENVLAVRFRFLQKNWVSRDGNQLKIDHQAADALLDTSQGFIFGQVLHKALKEWKGGAEKALQAVLKEIGSLEPKDFAYLFRFRLASEGERMGDYLEWLFGENLRALVAEKVNWQSDAFKQIDDQELSKGIEGAFEGPSVPIARLYQRVRVDEHEKGARIRHRLGDMFIKPDEKRVMVVITPDCDLVPRGSGPKVKRVLTMDGELRSFDQDSASADQFIFYKEMAFSLKWNPKTLNTFAVSGAGSLESLAGVEFLGTLRPLYAQEVQRLALTDLGRIGLAVAPTMGMDAAVTVHLRIRTENGSRFEVLGVPGSATATVLPERGDLAKGHRVLLRRSYIHTLVEKLKGVDAANLLPEDAEKLGNFLRAKNEDLLISGFLIKGAATKDKGPLATTIRIATKPDSAKEAAWLQLTLKLSEEAMEELLSVDPAMVLEEETGAAVAA